MFYAEVLSEGDARFSVPHEHEERAAYVVEGSIELIPESETFHAGQLIVFNRVKK
jgi:hypothetical protein